jgi:hypothetical protein
MDPLEFLKSLGGVARVGLLRREGYSERAVRGLAFAGAVQPCKGVWALPNADPEFLQAIIDNSLLTCASSASRYQLWIKDRPWRLHLASKHHRSRHAARHGLLRFEPDPYLPIASLEDTVIHGLTCLSEVDALAIAQSAMQHHGVRRAVLESEMTAKYFGTARKRLAKADGLSESVPEISARLLFESAGITFQRRDMSRSNIAQSQGYAVLSYAPEQIWNSPDAVLREIQALLDRGSPHG